MMATNWEEAVTFDDNIPKDGYCRLHLQVEDLKVSGGIIRAAKATNADINTDLQAKQISVTVNLNSGPSYTYVKDLVEPIDPKKSKVDLKDGYVVLTLRKVKDVSWAAFEPDLTT